MFDLIPDDVLREICKMCDYSTNFSLRWVCKRFINTVNLPPKDVVRKSWPRMILAAKVMTAIATVDGNYNIVKWLRGLGYTRSYVGAVLVGAHCEEKVTNYYCNNSSSTISNYAQYGRIYSGKITQIVSTDNRYFKYALRGCNTNFLINSSKWSITTLLEKCVKWNHLEGIKMLNELVNVDYLFPSDGMSEEMYRLCMKIRPTATYANYHQCRANLELALMIPHINNPTLFEQIKKIQYNPLQLLGDCVVNDYQMQCLVKSIDPRVHHYYKPRIVNDQLLLIMCNRISWIKKYFHTAQNKYSNAELLRASIQTNNYQIVRFLLDTGAIVDDWRANCECNDPQIEQALYQSTILGPYDDTCDAMHDYLRPKVKCISRTWIKRLIVNNEREMLSQLVRYPCFQYPIKVCENNDIHSWLLSHRT